MTIVSRITNACLVAIVAALPAFTPTARAEPAVSNAIDTIPEGYHLYAYDDCGVSDRQPHMKMDDSYLWTFATSDTDADLKSRSAIFSFRQVRAAYDGLDPHRSYVIAVTYANDHVYKRVQSLEANGVQIHGPHAIPNAIAERLVYRIPESVTRNGRMNLEFKLHGEANVTVSSIELWATGEPKAQLHFDSVSGLYSDLVGRVCDMSYEPAPDVQVRLFGTTGQELATTQTAADGHFVFARTSFDKPGLSGDLRVVAGRDNVTTEMLIPRTDLVFSPVRYRPRPTLVKGLSEHELSLNGTWRICTSEPMAARSLAPGSDRWRDFIVPGQWLQQGYDIALDQTVAVAHEFQVPALWQGYRAILRFDSIHAGTRYWMNGRFLGESENLFTPVEWDVTDCIKPGVTNRLDLEMKADTVSEKLSYSSGYAFHNLGGIDRAVRLFALPPAYMRQLHLSATLDEQNRHGLLTVGVGVEGRRADEHTSRTLVVSLLDPNGRSIPLPGSSIPVDLDGAVEWSAMVPDPLKWNAEQPRLYRLAVELVQGGDVLERVERSIGFRRIEVRGSQLYVNGSRVKLAGVCRHEQDPLTGRADTMKYAEGDVRLMKQANLNYIRTSHYPPPQELLDAADRLGMYVEVEAPFCWVPQSGELSCLRQILTPTSAMIDYCHTHPSVIIWSIANESTFNPTFEISNRLIKDLDPTRITTFNNPDPKQVCDTGNWHYPHMPYDDVAKEDKRPILLGEYFFPICHEQTDVMIDPGLRELYGHGQSDPGSEYARQCATNFSPTMTQPGGVPGFWTHIYQSDRIVGAAIWAAADEPYYFSWRKPCGYAWVHGFWGLIDGWRRTKPEWWMAKLIFSPVWFPNRLVDYVPGQKSVRVAVENRYSFTNLKDLHFEWECAGTSGTATCSAAPRTTGALELPVPSSAKEGDKVLLRVLGANGDLVNALKVTLGHALAPSVPQPGAAAMKVSEEGRKRIIEGHGFSLVFDADRGDFVTSDPRHTIAALHFPSVHVTRFDFGDLAGPKSPPYAVFPDADTRKTERTVLRETTQGLEITVHDTYKGFAGAMTWLLDADGVGRLTYDYAYTGKDMNTREAGVRMLLKPACDKVTWRRWSEWDVFPEDSISRTEGEAEAHRPAETGTHPEGTRPTWPWRWDETELGTNDFRGVKLNIYEGALMARDGSGVRVHAKADAHIRPCLDREGVMLHVLSQCRLGPVMLKNGDHVKGSFAVCLQSR